MFKQTVYMYSGISHLISRLGKIETNVNVITEKYLPVAMALIYTVNNTVPLKTDIYL